MLMHSVGVSALFSVLMHARSHLPRKSNPSIKGALEGLCVAVALIYIIEWSVLHLGVVNNRIIS